MKFPISNFHFPIFRCSKSFTKILTLFIGVGFVLGLFFVFNVNQAKACYENTDCNSNERCVRDELQMIENEPGECVSVDAGCESDDECGDNAVCQGGQCISGSRDDIGDGGEGDSCTSNSDCESGLTCNSSNQCAITPRGGSVAIENPLSSDTIPELLSSILSAIIGLIGMLAVASFVYGGILYMASGGSEEQANKGKKVLLYSTMGLIVSILSYVIVNAVIRAITG